MVQNTTTIADMQELASRKNGKCLSGKYITGKIKLLWECKQNHRWEATPAQIKLGRWCPLCAKEKMRRWFNYEKTILIYLLSNLYY
jgi:hypothetical protein